MFWVKYDINIFIQQIEYVRWEILNRIVSCNLNSVDGINKLLVCYEDIFNVMNIGGVHWEYEEIYGVITLF